MSAASAASLLDQVFSSVGKDSPFPMITVDQALQIVLDHAPAPRSGAQSESELVSITDAVGLVSAETLFSPHALPPFHASILDGFAISVQHDDDNNNNNSPPGKKKKKPRQTTRPTLGLNNVASVGVADPRNW